MRSLPPCALCLAGGHALNIEYYQGSGGAGIRFRWQGPDSSGIKEIVPTSAFQTPPPSTSICLSCGSPGEVAFPQDLQEISGVGSGHSGRHCAGN